MKLQKAKQLPILSKLERDDIEKILSDLEAIQNLSSNHGWQRLQKIVDSISFDSDSTSFTQVLSNCARYEKIIKAHIYQEYCWKTNLEIPHDTLKQYYDQVFNILRESDDNIHVCTTNYDLIMEHYMKDELNLHYTDGFLFDDVKKSRIFNPEEFDKNHVYGSNITHCSLYKLHGSLNWRPYHLDPNKICNLETDETYNGDNYVIYPTLSKKNEEYCKEPYLTMMEKFKDRINNSDVFIAIGYSFRDKEINKQFKTFLNRENTKMFVISRHAYNDTQHICNDENKIRLCYDDEVDRLHIDEVLGWYETHADTDITPEELKIYTKTRTGTDLTPEELKTVELLIQNFFDEKNKVYNFVGEFKHASPMFEIIKTYINLRNRQ